MKKLYVAIFVFIFSLSSIYSQSNSARIYGKISDSNTGSTIKNVNIRIKGTNIGSVSLTNGHYSINVNDFPATVIFSHVGYEKYYLKINYQISQKQNIKLKPLTVELEEFSVSSEIVKNILKNKPLHISDYEFYENNILLLAYKNRKLSKARIILVDHYGDTVSGLNVRKPEKFYKDCFDNVHLICRDTVWQIYFDSKKLQLLYPVNPEKFELTMKNCVEESGDNVYFMDYAYHNQVLQYYYYNRKTDEAKTLRLIGDERAIEMVDDFDGYIQSLINSGVRSIGAYIRFDEMCMIDPIFVPLKKIGDTICIFNYVNSVLEFYDHDGVMLCETPVDFHNNKHWVEDIFVDEVSNKVYTFFKREGISYLHEINLENGTLGKEIIIPDFPFVSKIQINNNKVFFLYTEKSNIYKKYNGYRKIYKMQI
ncbi:MAG: carboxypeptidase-like regulatory domain-containing protein [Bacteroidales bacterium]|nr:carboxypeptidase-like regulatory domain-containing protein [Bacteroidales bacterium]